MVSSFSHLTKGVEETNFNSMLERKQSTQDQDKQMVPWRLIKATKVVLNQKGKASIC